MKKNGFTLAEMVITLCVIGVIATIVLPAINNAQPNREMIMLKKAYYNTTRIVSELINDEDFYPDAADETHSGFSHTNIAGVNGGNEATFHGLTYSDERKFCGLFAAKLNLREPANCDSRISLASGGNFTTTDGAVWSMPYGNFSAGSDDGSDFIYVDVDGPDKGNNCTIDSIPNATTCATGVAPDQFAIEIGRFGNVSLPGVIAKSYVASHSTTKKYSDFLKEVTLTTPTTSGYGETTN